MNFVNLKSWQRSLIWISVAFVFTYVFLFTISYILINPSDLKNNISTLYFSQEENLLYHEGSTDGKLREWTNLEKYPEYLKSSVVEIEDKRFHYHLGIDPIALTRILYQYLRTGKLTGGASTIPQQLSRILNSNWKKDPKILRKFKESIYATLLSIRFSKDFILEAYLNSVSIRNNSEGFAIASKRYFQKNPKFLSHEEIFGLIALLRNNYPNSNEFRFRVQAIAEILEYREKIDFDNLEIKLLQANDFRLRDDDIGSENYHFIGWLKDHIPTFQGNIISTLSSEINRNIYNIVLSELSVLGRYNATNASVVVFEKDKNNPSSIRLISMIGSKNFFDYTEGQVNGAIAYRDAGSILKPLLYALAIEREVLKPNSILDDSEFKIHAPNRSEIFIPKNADLLYWGKLTLAEALANSRNIPAYKTIDKLGVNQFRNYLNTAGINHMSKSTEFYGHGLALGTGGVSLFQITHTYSSFINSGILPKIELGIQNNKIISIYNNKPIMKQETAEEIRSILVDSSLRTKAFSSRGFLTFPYPIGLKTGTSKDFKNSWTIGFSDRYIVGTWVGNFSGEAMDNVSGNYGAGRVFQSVMRYLIERSPKPDFQYPTLENISICRKSGNLPNAYCPILTLKMRRSFHPKENCSLHSQNTKTLGSRGQLTIKSPAHEQVFYISKRIPKSSQKIAVEISNFSGELPPNTIVVLNNAIPISFNHFGKANLELDGGDYFIEIITDNTIQQSIAFKVVKKD
ncbi:transglycosylase domain-containing protein [Leptospira sp. GIMC2001]|uniref:transglycosylase domain-containing protein n=1 Tax=Leptospira sp. GIMC2001 TaxID=1513297 RepID=UPI00234A97E7|nr:transglycosylase domain-containing protein [Leptospira sp. GIMC2001]WCL50106.1 transglycosylase domain-containing protein [Leptospira sp. GIMC2001]